MSDKLEKAENEISTNTIKELHDGIIAIIENDKDKVLVKRQAFQQLLDRFPRKEILKQHPYMKNVVYLPISHIEGLLDALFFGQWETTNFQYLLIGNELSGSMELSYIDPITDRRITKVGAAAEQVQVNALPDAEKKKMSKSEISMHSLDLQNNKKPAALTGLIGSLKTDCLKNAAKSIGNAFGRSINRDIVATPFQILPTTYDRIKNAMNNE